MTKLAVFVATSLDGYIATDDGSLEWLERAADPAEDYGFDRFLAGVDALAMGRGTYDHIASLDTLPFGDRPVIVFTHRPPLPRPGVSFVTCSPQAAVAEWRAAGYSRVYLDGGQVISDFLAAGLIDELTITTAPVLLGSGRRLFHPIALPAVRQLHLVATTSWPSGMAQATYVVGH